MKKLEGRAAASRNLLYKGPGPYAVNRMECGISEH